MITALCLIAVSLSAQPQLEKGKLLVGVTSTMALGGEEVNGSSEMFGFGFWKESYSYGSDPLEPSHRGFAYNMLPKAGYFIMDNLAAGLEVFVSGYTFKDINSSNKYKYGRFGAGPFARYYYPLDNIYPFGEVRCLFGTGKYDNGSPKESFMVLGLSAGAAIPLGDMVTFDLLAGYFYALDKRKADSSGEYQGARRAMSGFMINLGFAVYLDESHFKK